MEFHKFCIILIGMLVITPESIYSQSLSGSASSSLNPKGGVDATLSLSHGVGNKDANLIGGGFVSGNTADGSVSRGLFAAANKNGHSLGLEHTVSNHGKSLTGAGRLNLFDKGDHKLDAIASHTRTHLDNGFKFTRNSAGLDYNHAGGHQLSLTGSHIPQLNMRTLDAAGKANLWKSPSGATTFDVVGGATKHLSGPFRGQFDKHIGAGLTTRF